MYGTGLGATNPLVPAGAITPVAPLTSLTNDFAVYIGAFTQQADILFAGLAPGEVGVYQVNFQVPQTTPAGTARIGWWTVASGVSWDCEITVGGPAGS